MKKIIFITGVLLTLGILAVSTEPTAAHQKLELNLGSLFRGNKTETTLYNEDQLVNAASSGNNTTFVFEDGSTITIEGNDLNPSDFEFIAVESYNFISPTSGGAINFPDTVGIFTSTTGTSNYPPTTKHVSTTRNKAYQDRIYVATYGGNIPHAGTQGSTGGGKTYTYKGKIPYLSHYQR